MNRRLNRSRAFVAASVIALVLIAGGPAALATTYTVTNLNETGTGSLRAAVDAANAAGGTHDIVFQDGLSGTISYTAASEYTYGPAAMKVTCTLTITGPSGGVTLARSSGSLRLFNVTGSLTLDSLTVHNFAVQGGAGGYGGSGGGGGGAGMGGAIYNMGTLIVRNCLFRNNTATGGAGGYGRYGGGPGGGGGGMCGNGGSCASYSGGGGGGTGGTGGSGGSDSSSHGAGGGGGGANGGENGGNGTAYTGGAGGGTTGGRGGDNGAAGSSAAGSGGGGGGGGNAYTGGAGSYGGGGGGGGSWANAGSGGWGAGGGGGTSYTGYGGNGGFGGGGGGGEPGYGGSSTFGGGSGYYYGGGGAGLGGVIFNHAGTVSVSNSTFTANSAVGGTTGSSAGPGQGLGGAIFTYQGTVTLLNSTISSNTAASGGRDFYACYGLGHTVNNCILAQADASVADLSGYSATFTGVNNIVRTYGGSGCTFNLSGTLTGDPLLGALAGNGGPTQSLLPQSASPAADAGGDSAASGLAYDQRGSAYPRRIPPHVDIGAVEFASVFTLTYSAGAHGTLSGATPQTVPYEGDGTAVTAVPDSDYEFVQWNDGLAANPRTDTNVTADLAVTAAFATAPTVTTATVSDTTTTSANCGGEVTADGGAEVTARGLCWSASANPTIADPNIVDDDTGTGAFTGSMIGLRPGTTCHVRAFATNAVGTSYGGDVEFTTTALSLVRLYEFNGDFTDSLGSGESLVEDNTASSSFGAGDWMWTADSQPGGGLVFDTASTALASHYSIGIRFKFNQVSSYRKIIDFKNHTSDRGFYFYNGHLNFYPEPAAPSAFDADTMVEFILSRDAGTKRVTVYMVGGGVLSREYQFTDDDDDAVATLVAGKARLRLFQDDNVATGEWTSGGTVYNVRVWNGPLSGGPLVSAGGGLDQCPGCAPAVINSGVVVGHIEDADIESGTVTISSGFYAGDVLAADMSGTNISAAYDPGTHVLTLGGTDTPAHYQQVMRTATFAAARSAPDGARTITYAVSDGTLEASDTTAINLAVWAATVTTAAISEATATTATCGGEVTADGGADVTARGVCWSTSADPTIADPNTADGTGTGTFVSHITGLAPAGTYRVRAYATNSTGTTYGSDVEFTAGTTTPTVTTAAVSSVTTVAAVCGGNITADGGAAVTARGVCWRTTADPTIADPNTADGSGVGEFESSITGLSPGGTYHIRAYATNSAGTGYGEDIEFTAGATPPMVTTAAVSDITATTAVCGGNVTATGGAPVTVRGVCWSTSPSPTTANAKTADGGGAGAFVSGLTGLGAETTYHVRAYATNSAGTAYGADRAFVTAAAPPGDETPEDGGDEAPDPNAPDLHVVVTSLASQANVGEEITFGALVQNMGTAAASSVTLSFPLPPGTEFVSAWRVTDQAGQSAPLVAHAQDGWIYVELGEVAPADAMSIKLVLRAQAAGRVTLTAGVACAESVNPAAPVAHAEVNVEDAYLQVVNTVVPIHACGGLGLTPLLVLAGLVRMKRRVARRR